MDQPRDLKTQLDIEAIIDGCTGVGELMDELTLLRVSLRAYLEGKDPADAVAWACEQLSNSITKHTPT